MLITGKSRLLVLATSVDTVKKMILELNTRFNYLKRSIGVCIEKQNIPVNRVADVLTSLSPDDDGYKRVFLESHIRFFVAATSVFDLFVTMNFHWNYLDPSLLAHLVRELGLCEVDLLMKLYSSDLQYFRRVTTLTLFCQAQKEKRAKLALDFQEVIAEFDWPENVTLEDVEQFRQEYASHHNLQQCAMMIAQVLPGSFIVTWFIPQSIVEKLKENVPRVLLKQYSVTKLEIGGTCVYPSRKPQEVSGTGCRIVFYLMVTFPLTT